MRVLMRAGDAGPVGELVAQLSTEQIEQLRGVKLGDEAWIELQLTQAGATELLVRACARSEELLHEAAVRMTELTGRLVDQAQEQLQLFAGCVLDQVRVAEQERGRR